MRGSVRKGDASWLYVLDRGRDQEGRRLQEKRRGFRTRKEAEAALRERLAAFDRGMTTPLTKATVRQYLDGWLTGHADDVKAGTWDSYRVIVARHVLPHLGDVQLQALTPTRLNQWYADLQATGLAVKTVRNIHVVLRKALGDAVDEGLLVRNVAALSKPPKLRSVLRQEMKTWTGDEAAAFLQHVRHDRLYPAWLLLLSTGMRRGEALGLRWADVDLDGGQLTIRQALVSVNYRPTISTPKNHKPRSLSLDDGTVAALRTWKAQRAADRLAWGPAWEDTGLVFGREDGSLIHPDRFTQMFDLAVKRSGLQRIRLHDLRHTNACLLLAAGESPKVVSERLGHANVAFTLQVYAHVIPAQERKAADRIGAVLLATQGA